MLISSGRGHEGALRHCVLLNVPEDGLTTSVYHIGCLCIDIRDVSPDGGKRAVRRRQNDQRLLLRASQFDPNKMELGRPAQSGAPDTRSDPLLRAGYGRGVGTSTADSVATAVRKTEQKYLLPPHLDMSRYSLFHYSHRQ
jgi:hypothetical protein